MTTAELSIESSGKSFRLYPNPEPIPPGQVAEATSVEFHLRAPAINIYTARLSVDDVQLDLVPVAPDHVRWKWTIGFNAGIVVVSLQGVGEFERSFEVVTDPAIAKLTRNDYAQMVGDILADTLALVSLSGHGMGVARGERLLDLARLYLIRRVFDRFETSVREIDRSPWLRIERVARSVPLGHAQGVTPLQLSHSMRSARRVPRDQLAGLSTAGRRLAESLGGRLPVRVTVFKGKTNHRRREHSDILMVAMMFRAFLVRASAGLSDAQKSNSERMPRIHEWIRHVRNMLVRIDKVLRLPLFEGLYPTRGPIAPSLLYQMVPAYRAFYRSYRDFMAGLADVVGEFLRLPLRRTYELYELWCFLRLARAAAARAGQRGDWKQAFVEVSDHGGLIRHLEARELDFGSFRLVYQPFYREIWKTNGPVVGSFSRPMQPDIAIVGPGHSDDRPIIVLDAKYRIDGGLNDAVSSVHMYRDALVHRIGKHDDMSNRRVVAAAFLLSPQFPLANGGSWRNEDTPAVFFREAYRESLCFGAITMRPGLSVDAAASILDRLVALATTPIMETEVR